jgi:hypothetical protein
MPRSNETRDRAESVAADALRASGFQVTNLNDLAGNFPADDLAALRGNDRLLVQVRGTTGLDGKFTAPPAKGRILSALADGLGCRGAFTLAHLTEDGPVIRFGTAAEVTRLAEEDEAAYDGINHRRHPRPCIPSRRLARPSAHAASTSPPVR